MDSYEDRCLKALAASLEPIEGLQQSPYILSNPTAPVAECIPGEITYDETFGRGFDEVSCVVRVTVGASADRGAQIRLRQFRDPSGPTSIKEALEADRTLGGLVHGLRVTSCGAMRQFRRPEGEITIGCDFEVEWNADGGG